MNPKACASKPAKEKIAEIKRKAKECIGSRKGANNIIDLFCFSQDDDLSVAVAALRGLQQVFVHYLTSKEMYGEHEREQPELSKEEQYVFWLQDQYNAAQEIFLEKLNSNNVKLQELALVALTKFVELEGKDPLHKVPPQDFFFPWKLYHEIVGKLLSSTHSMDALIMRLCEITDHDDARYFLLKALRQQLSQRPAEDRTEVFLNNMMCLLENLEFPADQDAQLKNFWTKSQEDDVQHKVSSLKEHKKLLTAVWMKFLKSELSPGLYRRVLTKLDEKVIPHLSSPLVLSDFLTESYKIGGAISLLALNGLFILIHNYNLDYPDFYRKLYSLLEPQVYHVKYTARFFHLLDLFLSSTHLPAYLVASFIKRLSRLALRAPSAGARLSIVLVRNLIVRHPNCSVLLHNPACTEPLADPFIEDESDPAKTHALESSLWEIQTLQNHFSPEVALAAREISKPANQEKELSSFLGCTSEEMMEIEVKKKQQNVVMASECPVGLYGRKHTVMKELFIF
ncbi:nucleolar complex protein 4 homolog B-like [Pomacea canaliculata]|uniref:nucleolar complex protein 4 homolog B-like n=1 Tax=Pomacea canaliculata TaxID=400727 RepID=UPI000D734CD6|nr:nucleolar complex protein 4 homolog B-like [Pomacea canaliculata]